MKISEVGFLLYPKSSVHCHCLYFLVSHISEQAKFFFLYINLFQKNKKFTKRKISISKNNTYGTSYFKQVRYFSGYIITKLVLKNQLALKVNPHLYSGHWHFRCVLACAFIMSLLERCLSLSHLKTVGLILPCTLATFDLDSLFKQENL